MVTESAESLLRMELTDSQIQGYVNSKLKLAAGKRSEYLAQVDRLIELFRTKVRDTPGLNITKFLKTGSLRKGTVLRPRDGFGVDADIAVFLKIDTDQFDLSKLHDKLRELLVAAYPNKQKEDFVVQPRTLGITFRDSELAVDLVPILPDDSDEDYGWQPSSQNQPPVKTSVKKQLEFLRGRKDQYTYFRSLVRLLKQWRNHQELDDSLRSFTIELLVCYLQDTRGVATTLEESLLRFFLFVAQDELRTRVAFAENGRISIWPSERVVILDPVNSENNVGKKITDAECAEIVKSAEAAWEAMTAARNCSFIGETVDYWKSIFGRSFEITTV